MTLNNQYISGNKLIFRIPLYILNSLILSAIFFLSGCDRENDLAETHLKKAYNTSRQALLESTQKIVAPSQQPDTSQISKKYYRHHGWRWSYRARTAILAYKIYGDIEHIESVLDVSLSYANLPNWNSWQKSSDSWFREITTVGVISIPILDLLILSKSDKQVNKLVAPHYDFLLKSVIQRVSGFDETYRRIGEAGYYVTALDKERIEATNHMALYAVALARLYQITQEIEYFEKVDQLTKFWIASTMYNDKGIFIWPYEYYHPIFFPFERAKHTYDDPERFWKATVTIELPVAAHQIGASVTNDLLVKVKNTLAKNMFENGKLKESIYKIDGEPHKRGKLAKISDTTPTLTLWHLLDCYLPPIENLDSELLKRVDPPELKSRALFGAVYGLYARVGGCETH
jgi:hypothetical protein